MKTCERPGCRKPHKAHGLCQSHYDHERGNRRANHHDRLVTQRARQRATQAIVRAHRDEYMIFYQAELQRAQEQAQRLGDVLLRSGRSAADQDEEDRIRLLEIACPACAAAHTGHIVCVACGQSRQVA